MQPVRAAFLITAMAAVGMGGLAARALASGVQPGSALQSAPVVVVEPAVAKPAPRAADPGAGARPEAAVPPADATGWPGAPAAFVLPEAALASCESQRVPHPPNFFVMRSTGTDDLGPAHGDHATYAGHVSVEAVCENVTQSGDLALELDVFAYGGDASHFGVTVGPSGLVVVSAIPGHGAETIALDQRIAPYPGGCGTLSAPDAGATHASLNDTFCFDAAGRLTHADLHERSTLVDGDTRQLDAIFDLMG